MRVSLLLAAFSLLFFCCKNNPKTAAAPGEPIGQVVELTKDFVDFYEKFHKDSAFQMAHIQFPLPEREAERMTDGTISLKLNWTADDWKIQSLPPLNTGEFKRDFQPISPTLMVEKISTAADVGYQVERRWAKLGGEWTLIFYSAGMVRQ